MRICARSARYKPRSLRRARLIRVPFGAHLGTFRCARRDQYGTCRRDPQLPPVDENCTDEELRPRVELEDQFAKELNAARDK
eukprot:3113756-Rhodomonas_salina.1